MRLWAEVRWRGQGHVMAGSGRAHGHVRAALFKGTERLLRRAGDLQILRNKEHRSQLKFMTLAPVVQGVQKNGSVI